MIVLATMPRETNTSLFTSHVTQGLLVFFCLIGIIFICLIFLQNYKDWSERKKEVKEEQDDNDTAMKSTNNDFFNSTLVSLIILLLFLFLVLSVFL